MMAPTIRSGSLLATLALLPALAACGAGTERPSVVLVVVDTLRADYLGAYGFQGAISPNLDALAAEGVLFERCFAQAPWTKPSTATLLTSLYPETHGLTNHEGKYWGDGSAEAATGVLPDAATTLAEAFRAAGYRTAAFVSNPWIEREYGFAQGFEIYDDYSTALDTHADELIDGALRWLRTEAASEPFFLYLHFMDVHAPYDAPKADYDALASSPSFGAARVLAQEQRADVMWRNMERPAEWASEAMRTQLGYWKGRYASGVRAFDRRFGRLIAGLRRDRRLDACWLVVTADHGEQLFEHGKWSHGRSLYDHQLHVPLILRPPASVRGELRGRRVAALVEHVDVMPTLLRLADVAAPAGMQGREIGNLVLGREGTTASEDALAFGSATENDPWLRSARSATHKLLLDVESGAARLYDLTADPGEQRDIADEQPELRARLVDELLRHLAAAADAALEVETGAVPEELRERLKELGY